MCNSSCSMGAPICSNLQGQSLHAIRPGVLLCDRFRVRGRLGTGLVSAFRCTTPRRFVSWSLSWCLVVGVAAAEVVVFAIIVGGCCSSAGCGFLGLIGKALM